MKKRPARDDTSVSQPADSEQTDGNEPRVHILVLKEQKKAVAKKGPRKSRWILIH